MNTRTWLRRAGLAVLIAAVCVSGWGWVRLLYSIEMVMKHERTLSKHVGAIVAHERRLQELEAMLGVRYQSGRRREPGLAWEIACSRATFKREPRLLEVYSRE